MSDKKIQKEKLKIKTSNLNLRPVKVSDVTMDYVNGLNDPEVNRYMEFRYHPQTLEMVKDYVSENYKGGQHILLGLFIKESDQLIGTIRLHDISFVHMFGTIGICLFDKKKWGKGYGFEALDALIQYAFSDLGLKTLEAGAYAENKASVALFEKAGFKLRGTVPGKYLLEGRFVDAVLLGLVNPNWNEKLYKSPVEIGAQK